MALNTDIAKFMLPDLPGLVFQLIRHSSAVMLNVSVSLMESPLQPVTRVQDCAGGEYTLGAGVGVDDFGGEYVVVS